MKKMSNEKQDLAMLGFALNANKEGFEACHGKMDEKTSAEFDRLVNEIETWKKINPNVTFFIPNDNDWDPDW